MPNIRPVPLSVKDPELFAFLQNLSLQIYVANQIPGESIVAESITADKIKAGTITADKVAFSVGGGSGNFVIRSSTEPTERPNADPLVAGDIWIDTSDGDRPYTYDGADWIRSFTIIDGGDITTGTIDADRIAAGSITADKLNVSTLAAISAALGTITAGLLRDAGSTFVVDLDNSILTITDTQAVPVTRIRIGKLDSGTDDYGIEVYDASGNLILGADGLGLDVVGSDQIQDGSVLTDHLANSAVTTAKIASAAVTAGKLAADAVGEEHLQDLAVTADKVAASAITTAKIASAAVEAGNIATGAVTSDKIQDLAVSTSKLADAAVEEAKIAAAAITTTKIDDGAITTPKITAGAITTALLDAAAVTAEKIASKVISARHLVVGSFDNLAQNPGFESGSEAPHSFANGGGSWSITTGSPRSGAYHAIYDPSGQTAQARIDVNGSLGDPNLHPAAAEGDAFAAECWARCAPGGGGVGNRVRLRLDWRDASGASISTTLGSNLTTTTTYQKVSVTGTAPAGTAYVALRVEIPNDGNPLTIRIDDIYFRRMVEGSIVVDGTITTGHLAANSITAGKIAAGEIKTTHLAAGAVTTAKLDALAVTAEKIDAGAITSAKIAAGEVTATHIATDAIQAEHIAAGEIETIHLAAGAVTTAKIDALAVTSQKIAAGAITASKLAVGGAGAALNDDPTMSDLDAWELNGTWTVADVTSGPAGPKAFRVSESTPTTSRSIFSRHIPIDVNRTYRVSVWAVQTAGDGGNYLSVGFYDANGVRISGGATGWSSTGTYYYWRVVNQAFPSTWTRYEFTFGPNGTATIPSGAKTMRIGALVVRAGTGTSTVFLQDFRVEEVIPSVLIQDGAITADKIAANQIAASHIVAGTITATEIANSTITNAKIANSTITNAKIVDGTITGAKIANATITGSKLLNGTITATQIANSTITATQIANSTITGAKIVDGTITGAKIDDATITGAKIKNSTIEASKLNVTSLSSIAANIGTITAGKLQNAAGTRYLDLDASGSNPFLKHEALELRANGSATFSGIVAADSFTAASAKFSGAIMAGAAFFDYVLIEHNRIGFHLIGVPIPQEMAYIFRDDTALVIDAVGGVEIKATLTAEGIFDSTVTSHRRYKDAIRDFAYEPESLMALRPREWVYSAEAPRSRVGKYGAGFIADEVPLIFAEENGEGYKGERITAQLVAGWQDHERRIAALEARLAEALNG